MPILSADYTPPRWLRSGHANTIWPVIFRKVPCIPAQRVRLETPDDDFIDLDIMRATPANGKARKAAILSHGLEGCVKRTYMQGMAQAFLDQGWDVVGRHMRGCSGEPSRQPGRYHMGETDDLHQVATYCAEQGWETLMLVGFSMGGSQTLKYLGEDPQRVPRAVKAGAAVSVPCDLSGSAHRLSSPGCVVYMAYFMRSMREKMRVKASMHKDFPSIDGLDDIRTFDQFDERFTAPLNGFRSAQDYWQRSACLPHLRHIEVPTLVINAEDDPFLSPSCTPYDEARRNERLYLSAPRHGGHVGFVSNGPRYWTEDKVLEYVREMAL